MLRILALIASFFVSSAVFAADGDPGAQPPASAGMVAPRNATTGSIPPNHGIIKCSAAINNNGSVATHINLLVQNHIDPTATLRLGVGRYQVAWVGPQCGDVRAATGHIRWVQPDDLNTGAVGARYCTVADRLGFPAGVFVECFNAGGGFADTSFTITVTR